MSAASATKPREVQLVRKLTPKIIMGGKPSLVNNAKTELCSIAGIARKVESITTNYGESDRFFGEFVAVNLVTGEAFKSNRAFFPKMIAEELAGPLAAGTEVEFAFKLSVIPDKQSATGYVYYNEPVLKVRESDQMKALAEKIGVVLSPDVRPALPAPTTAKGPSVKPAEKTHDKKDGGKK